MKKSSKNTKKETTPVANAKPTKKVQNEPRNDGKGNTPASVATAEPERKSQGGIQDYSEVIAESVERVRGEFLADARKPKMTIALKTVTFNMTCVNLFTDCQHITINFDKEKRRLFVEPTVAYDETGLKFANFKDSRPVFR